MTNGHLSCNFLPTCYLPVKLDISKTYPKYLNYDTCSNHAPSTWISHSSPSSPPITLLLSALSFRLLHDSSKCFVTILRSCSGLTQKNQVTYLHTRGQVISIPSPSRNLIPILPIPIFTSFITASIYILKNQGDMVHPCLIPLLF